jgi:hypothetical protein
LEAIPAFARAGSIVRTRELRMESQATGSKGSVGQEPEKPEHSAGCGRQSGLSPFLSNLIRRLLQMAAMQTTWVGRLPLSDKERLTFFNDPKPGLCAIRNLFGRVGCLRQPSGLRCRPYSGRKNHRTDCRFSSSNNIFRNPLTNSGIQSKL